MINLPAPLSASSSGPARVDLDDQRLENPDRLQLEALHLPRTQRRIDGLRNRNRR
jgi:hypothetical protein